MTLKQATKVFPVRKTKLYELINDQKILTLEYNHRYFQKKVMVVSQTLIDYFGAEFNESRIEVSALPLLLSVKDVELWFGIGKTKTFELIQIKAIRCAEFCEAFKKRLVYCDSLIEALLEEHELRKVSLSLYDPPEKIEQNEILQWFPIGRSKLFELIEKKHLTRHKGKSRIRQRMPIIVESHSLLNFFSLKVS